MNRSAKRAPADPEAFGKALRSRGLKITPQRLAVHEVMMDLVHAGADEVFAAVKERGQVQITRATVFNILEDLTAKGIYARRYGPEGRMCFDVNSFRHVHLYDTRNSQFIDVEADELLHSVETGLKRRRFKGYSIDGFDIQIICHSTRKKQV